MVSKAQIEELWEKRESVAEPEAARKKQHDAGKLTARERVDLLADPGSFHELDALMESFAPKFGRLKGKTTTRQGVITGAAQIQGRPVYLYSQDFTVEAGVPGREGGAEDGQGHRPGHAKRLPDHRAQRLRRGQGERRGEKLCLLEHLSEKRDGFGSRSPDIRHPRAMRGWGGVLSRPREILSSWSKISRPCS